MRLALEFYIPAIIVTTALLTFRPAEWAPAWANHLACSQPVSTNPTRYQRGRRAARMGLPTRTFSLEYIYGASDGSAVIPIQERPRTFLSVTSGSRARYASGPFVWCDAARRSVDFSAECAVGKSVTDCQPDGVQRW
jgi:hypothetical protein